MRTILHRTENKQRIRVATAVIYIKDSRRWRETTRAEMQVLEIQTPVHFDILPMTIGVQFPLREEGEDGDYYALLYPVGWDGEVWSDTG